MSCINGDSPIPWNVDSKEFVCPLAGGLVFTIATAALSYFLISAPTAMSTSHIVSFTLLSVAVVAGFVTFVMGMYLYNRNQSQEVTDLVEDLENAKPVIVDEIKLQDSELTSLDYITQVRT